MIRVFLIHGHLATRRRLQHLLHAAPDICVVGHAPTAASALSSRRLRNLDVVVMALLPRDVESRGMSEQRLAQVPLIIFAPQGSPCHVRRLVHSYASSYLCAGAAALDLVAAVRTTSAGGCYICPRLQETLKQSPNPAVDLDHNRPLGRLTQRELHVFRELAAGKSNRETASVLGLSPKTVSTHRMHILAKLGLHCNVELARLAFENDLLKV